MLPDSERPVRRVLHSAVPAGEGVGVGFVRKDSAMAKASADGNYTTTDEAGRIHRFKVAKGDVIPDGAEYAAAEEKTESEPAKEQQAKRGPSETADAKGAKETG